MDSFRLSPAAGRLAAVTAAAAFLIHPLIASASASARGAPTPPIAVVVLVNGEASLQRAEQREPIIPGMPLLPGDRVSVGNGSVALMLADASLAELIAADLDLLSDAALRLQRGTLGLMVRAPGARQRPTLRAVHGARSTVLFDDPADVIITVDPTASGGGDLWTAVASGKATVSGDDAVTLSEGQSVKIMDGKAATVLTTPMTVFERIRQGLTPVTANFGMARGDIIAKLPAALRAYAPMFATRGAWKRRGAIDVWYPGMAADWKPFQYGRWVDVPTIGWTWASADMLPTTHYGRWNRDEAGQWFWIPGAEWQAAPVAWKLSSDYVGWSPLTETNTPVADGWTYVYAGYLQADIMASRLTAAPAIGSRARVINGPPPRVAAYLDQVVAQRIEAAGVTAATELHRAVDRFTYGEFSRTLATRPTSAPATATATRPTPAPAPVAAPFAPIAAPAAGAASVPGEPPAPQVIYVEPSPPVVVEVPVDRERPRHESRDERPRNDPPPAPAPVRTLGAPAPSSPPPPPSSPPRSDSNAARHDEHTAPARTPPKPDTKQDTKQGTKDDAKDDAKSSGGAVRRRPE